MDYATVDAQGGGKIDDILVVNAYSYMECINACASLNRESEKDKRPYSCRSVAFHTGMSRFVGGWGGNCFLKNATAVPGPRPTLETVLGARIV